MVFAVFVLNESEPLDGDFYHIGQIAVDTGNLLFHACNGFIGFVFAEFGDALHLYLKQTKDVVLGDLPHELWVEGCQALVNVVAELIG